jgi:hypothetical protein
MDRVACCLASSTYILTASALGSAELAEGTDPLTYALMEKMLPATAPATNAVWSVKPSFGLSIRLPFNSGGGN